MGIYLAVVAGHDALKGLTGWATGMHTENEISHG